MWTGIRKPLARHDMLSQKEIYDTYRELGEPRESARLKAFLDACRDGEERQRSTLGVDYSEVHVRQAIVHTRQDIWILVYRLNALDNNASRIRRRLTAVVVLLAAILLRSL